MIGYASNQFRLFSVLPDYGIGWLRDQVKVILDIRRRTLDARLQTIEWLAAERKIGIGHWDYGFW